LVILFHVALSVVQVYFMKLLYSIKV